MDEELSQANNKLQLQFLNDPAVINALNVLLSISSTCRKGFIKIIQNSVGGCLTMTSNSCRLLQTLSVSKPIIRIIVSAAQGHLHHFSDGGHFVLILILQLLDNSLKLKVTSSYLSELYEKFLTIIVDELSSDLSRINLDISSLKQMKSFAESIINTKPLCKLNEENLDYFSTVLVKLFVNYLPCDGQMGSWEQNVHFICDHGLPVSNSELIDGLLLQGYQFPKIAIDKLKSVNSKIFVAVVTVSMAGDTEELLETEYEINVDMSPAETVLKRIMTLCDICIRENIKILFCQRVIHPRVKNYLYNHNILPVDRIGGQMIPLVTKVTGAVCLRALTVVKSELGYLDSIEQRNINKKSYLFLRRTTSPVATFLLTNDHEESVQELKAVCSSALHSMARLAYSSYVLPGGGCWEIRTSYYLRKKVMSQIQSLMEEYNCSKFTILSAVDAFCQSLQNISRTLVKDSELGKTDINYHHFWRIPKEMDKGEKNCSCGIYCLDVTQLVDLYSKDDGPVLTRCIQDDYNASVLKGTVIIDQLAMCVNAVKTAVLTANSILKTHLFICDDR